MLVNIYNLSPDYFFLEVYRLVNSLRTFVSWTDLCDCANVSMESDGDADSPSTVQKIISRRFDLFSGNELLCQYFRSTEIKKII